LGRRICRTGGHKEGEMARKQHKPEEVVTKL